MWDQLHEAYAKTIIHLSVSELWRYLPHFGQ